MNFCSRIYASGCDIYMCVGSSGIDKSRSGNLRGSLKLGIGRVGLPLVDARCSRVGV